MLTATQPRNTSRAPREITGRLVLLCLLAFFGVVVGVNAVMIRAATSTFGGLETPSAYRAGIAFKDEIAASEAQDRRDWRVTGTVTRRDDIVVLALEARDGAGAAVAGVEAVARLVHPADRRRDHAFEIAELSAGRYRGTAQAEPGQWLLEIELRRGGERVFRSRSRMLVR